ncbi:MAG: hypothetical protein WDZ49_16670 [Litorilinea sp.]
MEAIEIVRVRLNGADYAMHNAASGDEDASTTTDVRAGNPTSTHTCIHTYAQNICLHLLAHVAALPTPVRPRWQIALLPHQRTPAAGIFGADTRRPLVVLRLYFPTTAALSTSGQASQPAREILCEAEIERDFGFPHGLATILAHLRGRVPHLEIVQPIRQITTGPVPLHTGRRHARRDSAYARTPATDTVTTDTATTDTARTVHSTRDKPPSLNAETAIETPTETPTEKPKGAPPLACNLWLERELARLPQPALDNPAAYRQLYQPWLAHYHALRGFYPQDPRRSFRAAVASARRRLGR